MKPFFLIWTLFFSLSSNGKDSGKKTFFYSFFLRYKIEKKERGEKGSLSSIGELMRNQIDHRLFIGDLHLGMKH